MESIEVVRSHRESGENACKEGYQSPLTLSNDHSYYIQDTASEPTHLTNNSSSFDVYNSDS